MSKVWFSPLTINEEIIPEKLIELYNAANFSNIFKKNEFTALKIHFGEKNNTGYIKPTYIKPLIEKIKETGSKPFLTDTNTLYKGQRQNSIDHLMQAYEHGFSIENLEIPIIIADGLLSKNFSEIEISGKYFQSVKIANDILHSDSMVVLSHMTGHILTGLGAAIKNLAMGAASRSGKQMQHSDVKPQINKTICTACQLCIKWCPVEAIKVVEGKAEINYEKCYGCGECIATCKFQAINHSFKSSSDYLQEKMVEYALGAVKNKEQKVCYFNFLTHITKECDCINKAQDKFIDDIGILASYDPVAIDQASVDLLTKKAGKDILQEFWPTNNYRIQLDYAEKLGLGSKRYELVCL